MFRQALIGIEQIILGCPVTQILQYLKLTGLFYHIVTKSSNLFIANFVQKFLFTVHNFYSQTPTNFALLNNIFRLMQKARAEFFLKTAKGGTSKVIRILNRSFVVKLARSGV